MFAKPFNLALVYVVTVFNVAILASPLIAFLVPFVDRRRAVLEVSDSILAKFQLAIFLIIFLVSFFMLCYLALDLVFGFAMRGSLKNCKRFEKLEDYKFLSDIFEEVKVKFGRRDVALYVKGSDEINAFAVASMGGKAIVLTSGLIDHYLEGSEGKDEFLSGLRSIMGHEMSHLINKDFLPTYLIIANQRATYFVSWLLHFVFYGASRVMGMVPLGGRFSSSLMVEFYVILNFFFGFFNRFVVTTIYEFLRKFVSRSIEYRCDRQSAYAFGGRNMASALSFLGEGGYFTLFSTHPGTKRRMKKVMNVEAKEGIVRAKFMDSLSNYFALMSLFILSMLFAKKAGVDLMVRQYLANHEAIYQKVRWIWGFKDFVGL